MYISACIAVNVHDVLYECHQYIYTQKSNGPRIDPYVEHYVVVELVLRVRSLLLETQAFLPVT